MPATELTDLRAAIRRAVVVLSSSGIGTARTDAELLAAHVLATPRTRLAVADGLTPEQGARLAELVARRAAPGPPPHPNRRAPVPRHHLPRRSGAFAARPHS